MKKRTNNIKPLTKADIKKFEQMLLKKRSEILGNVLTMEDETLRKPRSELSNMPIHMADVGTDNYEMENTLGLMDSERKLLMEIDDAFERIEKGTYGICEGTNQPIPKQRLKAIPWARYCVAYADLLERGVVQRPAMPEEMEFPDENFGDLDDDTGNLSEED